MKAVIMAGGEGTRLRPLTCTVPKPMVPIVNRPMMEHIVQLLKRHAVTEIANTLCYLPDSITQYFGDGGYWGVDMSYFVEHEPLGTAGSVRNAGSYLDERFIVVSGDSLTDIDLSKAAAFHRQKQALVTIVLTRVANPLQYGVVITDSDGRITQFLEKPTWSEVFSDTVNTGIYVMEPEVLEHIPRGTFFDFSKDLFPALLAAQAPLYGYVASGYWSDVGNLNVYRQAQQDCLDKRVAVQMPRETEGVYLEDEVQVAADATVQAPAYIGRQAVIGPGVVIGPYSVVGSWSHIDQGSSLKRTTLWSGVQVNHHCELRGVILAGRSRLEKQVKAFEGSVIGEATTIGAHSTVSPGIKVWPEKDIASGTRLNQTVVWGHQGGTSLFSRRGITGDIRSSLSPEYLCKIGLSFSAVCGSGAQVLLTTDTSDLAKTAALGLQLGLRAAGTHTLNGGVVAGGITRFGVQWFGCAGGLHCEQVQGHENLLNVRCWDGQGMLLSKQAQRKMESLLEGEDYPRCSASQLGSSRTVENLTQRYARSLAALYGEELSKLTVRLVVQEESDPALVQLTQEFLRQVGCRLNQPQPAAEVLVRGGDLVLRDEDGRAISDDEWWALFFRSCRLRKRQEIAVPIMVAREAVAEADAAGCAVRLTRADARTWMEMASELGNTEQDSHGAEFFPYVEPLVSVAEVLSLAAKTKEPLSSLERPMRGYRAVTSILCPWEQKGSVMRKLMEEADPRTCLFVDGVQYHTDKGWALVVPDGDEPLFQIYSEANSRDEAEQLAADFYRHIASLLQEGTAD